MYVIRLHFDKGLEVFVADTNFKLSLVQHEEDIIVKVQATALCGS